MLLVTNKSKLYLLMFFLLSWLCGNTVLAAGKKESVLGPGDPIKIFVYGHPDLTTETKVNDAGNITFPLIGEVLVDGLTPAAAERKLAKLLESRDLIRNPQVNILTSSLQSQMVSVLGNVRNQGRYPIEGKRSLTDILTMAGGILPEGEEVVTLIRLDGDKWTKQTVDVLDMVKSNDMAGNILVRSDDLIYVERAPRFYIYGEVQRAGSYRLERNMTVTQGLSVGGGLNPKGTERGLKIQRRDANGNLETLDAKPNDLIQPDDVIYVRESLF
ncbi:polysaccharide export outer membrane protein [Nitrosomonas sp. PY1]|uniref:polysaccharide export protein EpsE n=1 Tax=Nitrosomonas sp. PY1 TaxID=1803906 RepID=UPI001FC8A798|nr:polysaccharide export protein EpsE [Nitrosomonas sp. PY1]GKS69396.1 polysaccharide export outer membrane protein [Nitrosomonas sp. PY1]